MNDWRRVGFNWLWRESLRQLETSKLLKDESLYALPRLHMRSISFRRKQTVRLCNYHLAFCFFRLHSMKTIGHASTQKRTTLLNQPRWNNCLQICSRFALCWRGVNRHVFRRFAHLWLVLSTNLLTSFITIVFYQLRVNFYSNLLYFFFIS